MREPLVGDLRRRVSNVDSRNLELRVSREFQEERIIAKRREEKEVPPKDRGKGRAPKDCVFGFLIGRRRQMSS